MEKIPAKNLSRNGLRVAAIAAPALLKQLPSADQEENNLVDSIFRLTRHYRQKFRRMYEAAEANNTPPYSSDPSEPTPHNYSQSVPITPQSSSDPPVQIWFGNLKTGVLPLLLTEITSKVEIIGVMSTKEALCVSLESTDIACKLLEYYYEMLESRREETEWWKDLIVEIGDGMGTEPKFEETSSTGYQYGGDELIQDEDQWVEQDSDNRSKEESIDGIVASGIAEAINDIITVKEELVGLRPRVAAMEAMEASLAPEGTRPLKTSVPRSPSTAFHSSSSTSSAHSRQSQRNTSLESEPEDRLKIQSSIDSRAENLSSKISATFPPLPTSTISTVPLVIRNMPVMDEERLRRVLSESLLSDHQIISHTPILFRIGIRHHHLVVFTDIRTNAKESELLGRLNRTVLHGYRISVQRAKGQPTSSYVQKKDTSAIIPNPGSNTGIFKPSSTNETSGLARPTTSNFVHLFVDLHCHPSQKSDTYYQNKLQDLLQPYTERKLSFEMRLSSIGSRIAYVLVKSGEATKIIRFLDDSLFDGNRIRISLASPKPTSKFRSVPQPTTTSLNAVNLPPANDHRKPTNFPGRR